MTEGEVAFEDQAGEVALLPGAGDFPQGRGGGDEGEFEEVREDADVDVADGLEVAAVAGIGDAEDGGEFADFVAVGRGEGLEFAVLEGWQGLAVVAGDEGEAGDVGCGKVGPGLFADEAGGVFVVIGAVLADGPAQVVEPAGAFEKDAVVGAETVEGGELVEEPDGEGGNVAGVFGLGFEPVHDGTEFGKGGGVVHGGSRRAAKRSPRVLGWSAGRRRARKAAS